MHAFILGTFATVGVLAVMSTVLTLVAAIA
ncbi:hypothetical protein FOHLNKBM_5607 [Methylobacterium longum]|jgi:hypothetical protein|nr:hypothetical protein FOHLNKBM_5607 [Methylobacterium longum]